MRVVLIDTQPKSQRPLCDVMQRGGFDVFLWAENSESLDNFMGNTKPDALLIDVDSPSRDTIKHLLALGQKTPTALIIVAENDKFNVTGEAGKAGISMFIASTPSPQLACSLVNASIASFNRQQTLQHKLDKTLSELEESKLVARAKGLLMAHTKMSEAKAYEHIRLKAMRHRVTKTSVATDIIALVDQQSKTH